VHQSVCPSVTSFFNNIIIQVKFTHLRRNLMNIVHSEVVLSTHLIHIIAVFRMYSVKSIVQSEINSDLCSVCCYPTKDCNLYPIATLERPVKINRVRHVWSFSPTSFNICINQIITEWKEEKVN